MGGDGYEQQTQRQRGRARTGRLSDSRGIPAHRNEQRYMGGVGRPDVAAEGLEDYHLECKRTERLNLGAAMAQAEHDAAGKIPVVAHRANRKPWLITMKLSDWLLTIRNHEPSC